MTLQELFENAHLDALGMLDAQEQSQFQQALASVPPAVRVQVRHEQARAADMSELLPRVEPSLGLRDRVLAAIHAQMVADSASMAGGGGASSVGSDLDIYEMRSPNRVSRRWRTLSVGMIGACGVLAIALVNVLAINSQIKRTMAVVDLPKEVTRGLGSEHTVDVLFSRYSKRDLFEPSGEASGFASVLHNPGWDKGVVAYKDLPEQAAGQEYRLVVVTHDGQIGEQVASLGTGSDKNIRTVDIGVQYLKAGVSLAIVSVNIGADVASGTIRMQTRLS